MKIRRFFITFAIILFCQVTYAQKKRAKTPAKIEL